MSWADTLEGLLARATPGPWGPDWNAPCAIVALDGTGRLVCTPREWQDVELIAALRNRAEGIAKLIRAAVMLERAEAEWDTDRMFVGMTLLRTALSEIEEERR